MLQQCPFIYLYFDFLVEEIKRWRDWVWSGIRSGNQPWRTVWLRFMRKWWRWWLWDVEYVVEMIKTQLKKMGRDAVDQSCITERHHKIWKFWWICLWYQSGPYWKGSQSYNIKKSSNVTCLKFEQGFKIWTTHLNISCRGLDENRQICISFVFLFPIVLGLLLESFKSSEWRLEIAGIWGTNQSCRFWRTLDVHAVNNIDSFIHSFSLLIQLVAIKVAASFMSFFCFRFQTHISKIFIISSNQYGLTCCGKQMSLGVESKIESYIIHNWKRSKVYLICKDCSKRKRETTSKTSEL